MTKSESIKELAMALNKFKAEHPPVTLDEQVEVKTRTGGKYYFKFASLPQVKEKIDPFLVSNGLSVSQLPDGTNLTSMLIHSSGEFIEASMDLNQLRAVDEHGTYINSGPQDFGAILTYARRYAYCAILNIIGDGSDDKIKKTFVHLDESKSAGPSVPKEKPADTQEIERPWLNVNTPEWIAAVEYITKGDGHGEPSVKLLLKTWRINIKNREDLENLRLDHIRTQNLDYVDPKLKKEVDSVPRVQDLEYIYKRYPKLQKVAEFTDLLGMRKLEIQSKTIHAA